MSAINKFKWHLMSDLVDVHPMSKKSILSTFTATYENREEFSKYPNLELTEIKKALLGWNRVLWAAKAPKYDNLRAYLEDLREHLVKLKIGSTPHLMTQNAPQVQMPQKLTAEAGHKYLLTREFYVEKEIEQENCTCEGECEDCMSIEFAEMEDMVNIERIPIPWSTMKDIYNRVAAFEGHKQALKPLDEACRLLSEDEIKNTKIGKELFEKTKHHRMELKKLAN